MMTLETLAALLDSIKKWEGHAQATAFGYANIGRSTCPLCDLFNNGNSPLPCKGCPVFDATEKLTCSGTPYDAAWRASYDGPLAKFRLAAQAEVDFLKSLLPPIYYPDLLPPKKDQ